MLGCVTLQGRVPRNIHHGEERLVKMADGLDTPRRIQAEFRTSLSQPSLVLSGREDGNVQNLAWGS